VGVEKRVAEKTCHGHSLTNHLHLLLTIRGKFAKTWHLLNLLPSAKKQRNGPKTSGHLAYPASR
jgi:hypothetical protein